MQSCRTLIVQLISLLVLGITFEGRFYPVVLLQSLNKMQLMLSLLLQELIPPKLGFVALPEFRSFILNILCSGLHYKILGKYSFSQQKVTEQNKNHQMRLAQFVF